MPHFRDDDLMTSDEARMREGSNVHHEGVVFIEDGEHSTLDIEFVALKATLPDYTLMVDGIRQVKVELLLYLGLTVKIGLVKIKYHVLIFRKFERIYSKTKKHANCY
jgi:hypothetical protein